MTSHSSITLRSLRYSALHWHNMQEARACQVYLLLCFTRREKRMHLRHRLRHRSIPWHERQRAGRQAGARRQQPCQQPARGSHPLKLQALAVEGRRRGAERRTERPPPIRIDRSVCFRTVRFASPASIVTAIVVATMFPELKAALSTWLAQAGCPPVILILLAQGSRYCGLLCASTH